MYKSGVRVRSGLYCCNALTIKVTTVKKIEALDSEGKYEEGLKW